MIRRIFALPSRVPFNFTLKSSFNNIILKSLFNQQNASFTSIVPKVRTSTSQWINKYTKFLDFEQVSFEQTRTITKFSIRSGKRKSNNPVLARFFRLHWGAWIRTIAGRNKKLWTKKEKRRNFLRNHVFCNATQSRMLDKMVTKFWRKPKYYINDPYSIYHSRENFYITHRKPWRPEGAEYE